MTSGVFFVRFRGVEDEVVKITNAVYRLLDSFPQDDPLKNKAKEKALEILECSKQVFDSQGWLSLKKYLSPERKRVAEGLLDSIEILASYLQIAKHQLWISDVNFLIILKEYDQIKSRLSLRKIPAGSLETSKKQETIISKNLQLIPETRKSISQTPKAALGGVYSGRQEKILKMLRQKGGAQVSDIIKELPNVTKRTIRRDLDDLLKKEIIVRKGEWNLVSYQIK